MPEEVPTGWMQMDNALTRTIQRADFVDALAFVVEVARLAEAAAHHPDIDLHGYRSVRLRLTTHSAGNQITAKDFALADKINELNDVAIRLTGDKLRHSFL